MHLFCRFSICLPALYYNLAHNFPQMTKFTGLSCKIQLLCYIHSACICAHMIFKSYWLWKFLPRTGPHQGETGHPVLRKGGGDEIKSNEKLTSKSVAAFQPISEARSTVLDLSQLVSSSGGRCRDVSYRNEFFTESPQTHCSQFE